MSPRFVIAALALALLGVGIQADEAPRQTGADASQATTAGASPPVVPAYRQANRVAVLTVHGAIDHITRVSLERRVERALRDGATAVVLDINTPGGELTATLDICHLLKTDAPANTVAWINPQAYSAGTIIALAAREIVLQENASFGDAAPIIVGPFGLQPLPAAERAKAESPILEEVIDSARRNHYDEHLVQAFVSVGIELWLLENVHTGERVFMPREEYRRVFGEDPPQEFAAVAPPEPQDDSPIVPFLDRSIRPADVQPSPEAAPDLPEARQRLTEQDRGNYRLVRQVISSDRLLTLRPADAIHYGLAATIIRNDEELRAYFGAQTLVRYDQVWSEALARFLTSLPVRAVLLVIFLVALFIELSAPGMGVFGATALAALALLIGAPALVGMAQWWGIVLILIGLALIATELFVLPGLGAAGVLGLVSLLIGLVGTFVTGDMGTAQGRYDLWTTLAMVILSFFAAGIVIWLISRHIRSMPLLDRVILKTELGVAGAGATGGTMYEAMSPATAAAGLAVGALGVAHTDLRPNGRALFETEDGSVGRIIDVQSVEGFIEKGTPLRIVSIGRFVTEVERA